MINALRQTAKGKFVSQVTGVLAANSINNLVALAITVHFARTSEVLSFGVLTLAISMSMILSTLLDFGTSLSLVRELSRSDNGLPLRGIFRCKLALLFLIPLSVLPFLGKISGIMFPLVEDAGLLTAAVLSGGLLHSIWMTARAADQAKAKIQSMINFSLFFAFIRFVSYGVLLVVGYQSVIMTYLVLYPLSLAVVLICNFTQLPYRDFFLKDWSSHALNYDWKSVINTFHYSAWVSVSAISYIAMARIPHLALAHSSTGTDVATYGASLTFLAVFSLLGEATKIVLLPNVFQRETQAAQKAYLTALMRSLPLFAAITIPILLVAGFSQILFFGPRYYDSIMIFFILGAATLASLFLGFGNSLVHTIGMPKLDTYKNLSGLAILIALMAIIPVSALNVALAFAFVLIFIEMVLFSKLWRKFDMANT